jgi:uncharacterized protein YndB with AHSA1/START domain
MTHVAKTIITVETAVNASIEKVWKRWITPSDIIKWNSPSHDWHTTRAENDLRPGGRFVSHMAARDGSMSFDFGGTYDEVKPYESISYTIDDGRKVKVTFNNIANQINVVESFEAESLHPVEMQQGGWQAILDNFKKYAESNDQLENLHFEIVIEASKDKVYCTMLDEKQYAAWTAEFNPTSCFKGSWERGSKMLFVGTDNQGNVGGMVSRIKENIPNLFLSIEHYGIVQGDKEIISGPEVESWAGSLENYTFTEENGKTLLSIDMDSNQEFKSYFEEMWPKALKKLKEICES